MSLLLEALKRAEKAKEEAQRRSGADAAPSSAPAPAPAAAPMRQELSLQQEAAAEPKPVMTRSQLPDIHQPLEILSDDIAPARTAAPEPKPTPASSSRPGTQARAREEPAPDAARAGARKVFEVKFKETNPRLPFYITMGVLGVFALGTGVYFWYQLRPPQALVNPNPTPSAVAAAPSQPASPGAPISAAPAATTAGIPGLPGVPAAAATAPVQAPVPPAQARGPRPSAIPTDPPPPASRAKRPAVAAPSAPAADSAPQLNISRPVAQINPQVEVAYAAFMSGEIATARTAYEAALRDDPSNRDALLGLAAVDVRTGRLDAAEAAYVRLLRADPRDAHAQAGLLGLRSARVDPLAAETRVKGLLAGDPGAHVLNFALANQLAQQGRWPEAQQQYFKAYSSEPDNPDFAFNLAVSLDHLRQFKLARQYYERAVGLAAKRGASFDVAAARTRIQQLPE